MSFTWSLSVAMSREEMDRSLRQKLVTRLKRAVQSGQRSLRVVR